MNYVASFSGGKDSLAMVLRLIELGWPLTHVVFFDLGAEFKAVYNNVERMRKLCEEKGIVFKVLKPDTNYLYEMLVRPVNEGTPKERYGYGWCSNRCRHLTSQKVSTINKYLVTIGECVQYIGIAADEPHRIREEKGKLYPLVEWRMTEADCLAYCYRHGWNWNEDGVELYDVLTRVSCYMCANKGIAEIKRYRQNLPRYWAKLKGLQSKINMPFYKDMTIFDLEERFAREDSQLSIWEFADGLYPDASSPREVA